MDCGRFNHQWLPDRIVYEHTGYRPIRWLLTAKGHHLREGVRARGGQKVIVAAKMGHLEGGADRRSADGGAGIQ